MSGTRIPVYQVDAFASRVFTGNPAAVCPLEKWLPDEQMQAIAAENNLAETAFFVKNGEGYHLRWFTPTVEVDLCGHATLASGYVIMNHLTPSAKSVQFSTQSGKLIVTRDGDLLSLDFPTRAPLECKVDPGLIPGLGGRPETVLAAREYLVVYGTEEEVRSLTPDMDRLAKVDHFAVIATAPGKDVDFISRFFAPKQGIPEDPVTGSAHCTLIPYWSKRLGKKKLHAYQASPRGGIVRIRIAGDRVFLGGTAVTVVRGELVS